MPKLHDLVAFQRAVDLTVDLYEITNCFPKYELYGLTSQMRRWVRLEHPHRQPDRRRMQRLPPKPRNRLLHAFVGNAAPLRAGVERVADDGVAEVFEVDADLVGAAGAEAAAEHRRVAQAL